jgi:hypothetical protein
VGGYAPRARKDSVRPRRLMGASGRPLNFTVRPPVEVQRYLLGLGDGVYGPGDVAPLTITLGRMIKGPQLPNWQPGSILASLETPIEWHGELVRYVTLSPRYTTDTVSSLRRRGGVVAVGRVLPGNDPHLWTELIPSAVHYWAVGTLRVLEA